jgi:hypothetical protein
MRKGINSVVARGGLVIVGGETGLTVRLNYVVDD